MLIHIIGEHGHLLINKDLASAFNDLKKAIDLAPNDFDYYLNFRRSEKHVIHCNY